MSMLVKTESVVSSNDELSKAVRSVFDVMVGLTLETPTEEAEIRDDLLTAIVHITGEQFGAVVIYCPTSPARKFTGRFLDKDPPREVNEEVLDVLGELANMIAGNVKTKLMPDTRLSVPSVFESKDGTLSLQWHSAERQMFNSEVGAFWVSVTIAHTPEQRQLTAIQARAAELAKQLRGTS